MQEAKRKANYATWVARKKAEAKQLNREAQQKKQREEEKRYIICTFDRRHLPDNHIVWLS